MQINDSIFATVGSVAATARGVGDLCCLCNALKVVYKRSIGILLVSFPDHNLGMRLVLT